MKDSLMLINNACKGIRPERTPVFDLFRNDAVIEHFAGRPLDGSADEECVFSAVAKALDGTRSIRVPDVEGRTWTTELGKVCVASRWTSWVKTRAQTDADQWEKWIKEHIDALEDVSFPDANQSAEVVSHQKSFNSRLGGAVFIHCTPSAAINTVLYDYCGIENFSYLYADNPGLVLRWLRALEQKCLSCVEWNAHAETSPLVMIYADIAYKNSLIFGKDFLRQLGFFDNIAEICARCHAKGLRVIFHSDGYVMDIVADLIAAGIDCLNPIEKAAGMDIYELRRRFPELILAGGMDASHLLLQGSPEEIRTETRRMINETGAEGRLLIGSSTEVGDDIPLMKYLAFYEEVMYS